MAASKSTPIIVGVGEVCDKAFDPANPAEPADLMLSAIRLAIQDTKLKESDIVSNLDDISIVPPWTWPYNDLPGLVAEKLGSSARHRVMGTHNGSQPAFFCDEAARRISLGKSKLAVIAGGETLASLAACQKPGRVPPPGWTIPGDAAGKAIDLSDASILGQGMGARHSVGLPIHVYPMYENGFRSHEGQSFEQNNKESASLYAAFDEIACRNKYAWRSGEKPKTAETIGTVTQKNRMICTPYPLLMNAFNTVNLAAACILTSVEQAEKLGIPREKWTYVLGGAGTRESSNFWERPNYHTSPALTRSIDAALDVSGLKPDQLDCADFYSCFPIVPKLACKHLGLDALNPRMPITLLGGLTSFGGAGNNYSMHAITEMTRQLRSGTYGNGLILANGGVLTYQHAICLSSQPSKGSSGYAKCKPLPEQLSLASVPRCVDDAEGAAFIETYTVEFNRDGSPRLGHIVGRLRASGHRFVANHGNDATLAKLADTAFEPIDLLGVVKKGDGRNLFYADSASAKL